MADSASISRISQAGVVLEHPAPPERILRVAPVEGEEFNRVQPDLLTVASWRLEDIHFEFDSSFVSPDTFEVEQLKVLMERHPASKLSIFGHADPVGRDDYNKTLSGRRSQAIYGLLTRNVALWKDLYDHHDQNGKDEWGSRAIQIMQGRTGRPADGKAQSQPLPQLFQEYMDAICIDANGKPFQLKADDFLAMGKDPNGKGDYQGCGEFNPLVVFSKEDQMRFDKPENKFERNRENRPNRRVMILLFRPGIRVDPHKWPCPTAKQGFGGCLKRFWSDAQERRGNQAKRRQYKETRDTFACRFYDRIANDVAGLDFMVFRLQLHDPLYQPCRDTAYSLKFPSGQQIRGKTDPDGWLVGRAPRTVQDVEVTYRPQDQDVEFTVQARIQPPESLPDEIYLAHIRNFGFRSDSNDPRALVLLFQAAHPKLKLTGKLDAETREAIDSIMLKTLNEELSTENVG